MRRHIIFVLTLLLGIALVIASAYSQEDMESVSNEVFDSPQRTSARFFHDTHNETAGLEDCVECHHLYDDNGEKLEDESSEDQACSECHDEKDDGRKPGLRKAYHTNCKGCHVTSQKGPVLCAECHLK